MKCAHCEVDSKGKDRTSGRCPSCGEPFAFDPTKGDPITDMGFRRAIEAVSAGGTVWFGLEHLRYEVGRRTAKVSAGSVAGAVVGSVVTGIGTATFLPAIPVLPWAAAVGVFALLSVRAARRARVSAAVLDTDKFDRLWGRWQSTHGKPGSVIVRREPHWGSRETAAPEPDLADYSFDRAVICDRARTADLLLANNFHFENNCAVLAEDRYPRAVFDTVRTMLRRNPRLEVFVLHDATGAGCTLAHRLRTSPEWFQGLGRVTDVGLRPAHAEPLRKFWLPAQRPVPPGTPGITADEARWLAAHSLELACLRPEQVLKRLFRAMSATAGSASVGGGDGGGSSGGVYHDSSSFSTDAGADDGGADGFG